MNNYHPIFARASWPTRLGNAFNSNVSRVTASAQGEALWSLPLANRSANGIVVTHCGRVMVSSRRALTAVDADGVVAWRVESTRSMGNPLVLGNGCLLMVEDGGDKLVMREQASGAVVRSWAVNTSISLQPTFTPSGHILYNQYQPAETCSHLALVSLSGSSRSSVRRQLWSRPLANRLYDPPLLIDDLIIIRDGSYLRAYNTEGALQWIANRDGFQMANAKNRSNLATKSSHSSSDEIYTPPIWLGNQQLLAGFSWYSGRGLHLFDICKRSVRLLQPPESTYLPPKKVVATPRVAENGSCVVTVGWQKSTLMLDLAGHIIWQHQDPQGEAQTIIADAPGKVLVTSTVSSQIWDLYKDYYDLSKQSFLRGFAPDGEVLFTWYAPGPISRPLALGKAGEAYLVSDGRLWAIA